MEICRSVPADGVACSYASSRRRPRSWQARPRPAVRDARPRDGRLAPGRFRRCQVEARPSPSPLGRTRRELRTEPSSQDKLSSPGYGLDAQIPNVRTRRRAAGATLIRNCATARDTAQLLDALLERRAKWGISAGPAGRKPRHLRSRDRPAHRRLTLPHATATPPPSDPSSRAPYTIGTGSFIRTRHPSDVAGEPTFGFPRRTDFQIALAVGPPRASRGGRH